MCCTKWVPNILIQFDVEMGAWCMINKLCSRGLFVVGFVVGIVVMQMQIFLQEST